MTVWIPGVRWIFPRTPCNVVYIEHNIVQSVLYFNIHVVMMYVLYTQTRITFVYYTSNICFQFLVCHPKGISLSNLHSFKTIILKVFFIHNLRSPLFELFFHAVSSPWSSGIPPPNCPGLKILLRCMFIQLQSTFNYTSNSLFQFAVLYPQGFPCNNITQFWNLLSYEQS